MESGVPISFDKSVLNRAPMADKFSDFAYYGLDFECVHNCTPVDFQYAHRSTPVDR